MLTGLKSKTKVNDSLRIGLGGLDDIPLRTNEGSYLRSVPKSFDNEGHPRPNLHKEAARIKGKDHENLIPTYTNLYP